MIRVSTTTLEAYRRLVQTEWGTDQELVDQVRGTPWTPTWQMEAGTAWHTALETGNHPQFLASDIAMGREHLGRGTWEVKATRTFDLGGIQAAVVAKADHMRGLLIQDNKTTFTTVDASKYEPSIQWRFYLLVHQCPVFRYNVYRFTEPTKGASVFTMKEIASFTFWVYQDLERDCAAWVRRFVDWADSRGLLGFLEREGTSMGVEHAT
jgi:hypothetical protein